MLFGFAIRAKNPDYSVKYMAHIARLGNTEQFCDGEFLGSHGDGG
jgi:hypothetical protein